MRQIFLRCILFIALLSPRFTSQAQDPLQLELVPWATNLGLALDVTNCGDSRLFVARQHGVVSIITDSMQVLPLSFMNIGSRVLNNGERGLLGMAFDPDYATNGFFYVNYVAPVGANGTTRISRFHVSADPNRADTASEVVLLSLVQPDPIHQGGGMVFGPDGYLYIALGDGGGASDPNSFGQNSTNLFGTILRIKPEPDSTYSIPPDNPFANATDGKRPEIWAYGLRNPFRIGIDPANGDLWIGDVGQSLREEIDHWPGGDNSGPNFGWRCYEGDAQFIFDGVCNTDSTYFEPEVVHTHSVLGGNFCAIIGGEVYRGGLYPHMAGKYLYTDFCAGELRTLTPDGPGSWVDSLALASGIVGMSSIGADMNGELYATNVSIGKVYKIKDRCPMAPPVVTQDGGFLMSTVATSYQWYFEGEVVPGGTEQTILPAQVGNYTVQATYGNGCVKTSASFFYLMTGAMGSTTSQVRILSLPVAANLQLERGPSEPAWSIVLRDMTGRSIRRSPWSAGMDRMNIDVSGLPSGPYILDITLTDGRPVLRATIAVEH
ncbi:MAG: PQQ-dependent sugar dehydrogenase [Flavobacteriales bacterium]